MARRALRTTPQDGAEGDARPATVPPAGNSDPAVLVAMADLPPDLAESLRRLGAALHAGWLVKQRPPVKVRPWWMRD